MTPSASRSPGMRIDVARFDGLLLAGGHAPGMRQYLGSTRLQEQVARVLRDGPSGRRDLPRRAGRGAQHRSRDREERALRRRPPASPKYHGAHRVLAHRVEARPLLPDLSGLRRGRGARGARRSGAAVRARPDLAHATRHGGRHRARPSSSRTAATSRRVGPATRTRSRVPSGGSSSRADDGVAAARRSRARSAEDPRLRRARASVQRGGARTAARRLRGDGEAGHRRQRRPSQGRRRQLHVPARARAGHDGEVGARAPGRRPGRRTVRALRRAPSRLGGGPTVRRADEGRGRRGRVRTCSPRS